MAERPARPLAEFHCPTNGRMPERLPDYQQLTGQPEVCICGNPAALLNCRAFMHENASFHQQDVACLGSHHHALALGLQFVHICLGKHIVAIATLVEAEPVGSLPEHEDRVGQREDNLEGYDYDDDDDYYYLVPST